MHLPGAPVTGEAIGHAQTCVLRQLHQLPDLPQQPIDILSALITNGRGETRIW